MDSDPTTPCQILSRKSSPGVRATVICARSCPALCKHGGTAEVQRSLAFISLIRFGTLDEKRGEASLSFQLGRGSLAKPTGTAVTVRRPLAQASCYNQYDRDDSVFKSRLQPSRPQLTPRAIKEKTESRSPKQSRHA